MPASCSLDPNHSLINDHGIRTVVLPLAFPEEEEEEEDRAHERNEARSLRGLPGTTVRGD